jgi:hypothetical protein
MVVERPSARRFSRLAIPVAAAVAVTGTVVGAAIAWPGSGSDSPRAATIATPLHATVQPSVAADRRQSVSRSARRVKLTAKPKTPAKQPVKTFVPGPVTGHLYMSAPLNVRTGPGDSYPVLDVLPTGTKVAVTGRTRATFSEIVENGRSRWVTADYLSKTEPGSTAGPATGGVLSSAPCASGSSVESGITSNAVALHRAVCAHFPQVTTYGGWRNDGEHSSGRAIDIMVGSDSGLGQQIADWARANASILHVSDVIWSQHIWTVQRGSEGWRAMPDRGSTTANHYDHVHVEVY